MKVAVLSRGYGRKSKGFVLADESSSSLDLGDEPFQFYRKFKRIQVAVDEKRVHGIEQLIKRQPALELVLLDDAFQHRQVKAGFYILLTAHDDMYTDDLLLPAGNLREGKKGASRADVIIVTKCPAVMTTDDRLTMIKKINPRTHQKVFFSTISYGTKVIGEKDELFVKDLIKWRLLVVTGIADSGPLEEFLTEREVKFEKLKFGDHQFIGDREIEKINNAFRDLQAERKIILTTEKDYVRSFIGTELPVYYLPIETKIDENGNIFNELIQDYVRKN
jgi:tetraacyldisaccharide 4'-kinase